MDIFKLVGKIVIENDEANDAVKETTKEAANASDGITKAFKGIAAAVGTYLSVNAIKDFGLSCIQAAADANAASAQFSSVFGDLEKQASGALSKIADESGISENRMKGSFTQIAAFAKTTGMDTEGALALSERALVAVADSAAFYDRTLEETTESLQSFLKGNYENDAALGLSCTEVTRNAAANDLYGKSFKDLSEEQKQLTLLKMVEDANKASGALGQAAKEADTWTNQTGNLKQAWTDFQAIIGQHILPTAVDLVKKMGEFIADLGEKIPAVVEWFEKYKNVLGFLATAIAVVVAGVAAYNAVAAIQAAMNAAEVTTLGALIAAKLSMAAATLVAVAPYILIAAAIAAVIAICVSLYKNWDKVKAKCSELANNVKAKFLEIKNNISNAIENAKQAALDKFNSLKQGAIDKFNAIKSGIKEKIDAAKNFVKEAIDKIKGFFDFEWSLPKIKLPHFSISGSFSLNPPSIPHFSVDWYKKAMNNAMLLNDPTIFGYSAASGSMLGAGEAGTEVVAGANTLMGMIGSAVESKTAAANAEIISLLSALLDAVLSGNADMLKALLAGQKIVLNNREFARAVREYA